VGKALPCTALCTHFRFTIKYSFKGGVSVEKILSLPSFNLGLLNVRVNKVKNHLLICIDVRGCNQLTPHA
jgi:hypothetical protein